MGRGLVFPSVRTSQWIFRTKLRPGDLLPSFRSADGSVVELRIERSRVRVPEGATEDFSPWPTFCFDCYFSYPFHFRVSAVARTSSWSFCQKCRCQVTAKHTYALYRYVAWNKVTIRRCYVVLGWWRGGDSSVLITVFCFCFVFSMAVGCARCLWPQKGGNSSVLITGCCCFFPMAAGCLRVFVATERRG